MFKRQTVDCQDAIQVLTSNNLKLPCRHHKCPSGKGPFPIGNESAPLISFQDTACQRYTLFPEFLQSDRQFVKFHFFSGIDGLD